MSQTLEKHDPAFGQAVRARRLRLAITLGQLAEKTGISIAVLSRVERGHHSPTLHNAMTIARELGCELMDLLERSPIEITRAGDNKRFLDPKTGIERITLAHPSPQLEMLHYIIPAKATSQPFAPHAPGSYETFYILQGSLTLHNSRDTISLNTGDTATILVDQEHWFQNPGESITHFILVIRA